MALFMVSVLPSLTSADETPILRLETGGHTALCRWLGWTPDGTELVSVGDDKVVRVWDVRQPSRPRLARSLRLEIGDGLIGQLFAGAISPDGRILAVGGYFQPRYGDIRLLDLHSGRVRAVLKGHIAVIFGLAFSQDGRWLASASTDNTVRVWDISSGFDDTPVTILQGHFEDVHGVAFVPGAPVTRLVSVGDDKTGRIWKLSGGDWQEQSVLRGHKANVTQVACSPDGRTIATSSLDRSVRLWSTTGSFRKTLGSMPGSFPVEPAIAFAPNGKSLVAAGSAGSGFAGGAIVWSVPGREELARCDGHDNTVMRAAFAPTTHAATDGLIASAGGNRNDILLWRSATGEEVSRIVGRGATAFAAAWSPDGAKFAFGQVNRGTAITASKPLTSTFSLASFRSEIDNEFDASMWRRGSLTDGDLSTKPASDGSNTLLVYRGGRQVARIARSVSTDGIRCYAFHPGRGEVIVGSDFELTRHDAATGLQTAKFVGHEGVIWAVAVSPDGKTLLSAGDQTLRLWDLDAAPNDDGDVRPLLNFFFTEDGDDWIAWTNEGYYTGSPGADDLIGWHVNRGPDQAADFAAAWQYARVFRRPDIVRNVFAARSTEGAIKLAALESNSRATPMLDIERDTAKLSPPRVELTTPDRRATSDRNTIRVAGTATPTGTEPITSIRITVNGRPIEGTAALAEGSKGIGVRPSSPALGPPKPVPFSLDVPLVEGVNVIEVLARTKTTASQPAAAEVTYRGSVGFKPTLYVLGIGCADYEADELDLEYADDDVRVLTETWVKQKGQIYADVVTTSLIDGEVTDRNIRKAMAQIKKDVTQHDVLVMIVSGHGDVDGDGTYHFLPHDYDPEEDVSVTGVPFGPINEKLAALPCKVVLCMDTCHAGGAMPNQPARKSKGTIRSQQALNEVIAELVGIESGVVVFSSSTNREESFELDEFGHGAFALSLIEAIGGTRVGPNSKLPLPYDGNADGVISSKELDLYISQRVKELTGGSQHPVSDLGHVPDFPLAIAQ